MPKGGARTRSGPAPDPDALRRERDAGEWTILPPDGRVATVPPWPLLGETGRESDLWAELWSRPQGLMWERNGLEFEVALYVRRLAEAEQPDSPVSLGTLVRQMADSLGLTTPGMRVNRWRIARVDAEGEQGSAAPVRLSARDRLKAVPGGRG